jgi:pimeloyl-ACP methyl ester carboxylesterase
MNVERDHRARSADGTEIVGTARGKGPALVFVHGAMDDGSLQWAPVVPYLADRFTCHVVSVRNRGRSAHASDLSPPRLAEDVAAYASSLREPVGLVGLSAGGTWVLGAASGLTDVTGLAAYEPVIAEVLDEETGERLASVVEREAEAAQEGRLAEAVRIFAEFVANREELAMLDAAGAFQFMGANVSADLAGIRQSTHGPSLTDAAALAQIEAPVLLLMGGRTSAAARSWFHGGVRNVAKHVPHASLQVLPDVGHLAPMVAPEPVAEALAGFFSRG